MRFRSVLAICLAGYSGFANAAEIATLSGSAQVNRGAGFERVAVGEQLQPNDRLSVSEGYATIFFAYNCEHTVYAGESYRIPVDPQCERAARGENTLTQSEEAGLETIALWGVGLGVIGGLVAIGIAFDKSDHAPASP